MNQADTMFVTDTNGQRGSIESLPDAQNNAGAPITIRLENGQKFLVPQSVLTQSADGSYHLPFAMSEFLTAGPGVSSAVSSTASTQSASTVAATNVTTNLTVSEAFDLQTSEHQPRTEVDEIVIPLAAEQIAVDKRVVETGTMRVVKTVSEVEEVVNVPLISDQADVQRVAVNRVLDVAPEVRREGDTLIVPLLEEVLVVEKRLMLREELHIRMKREETQHTQQVTLRREDVQIERVASDPSVVREEPAITLSSAPAATISETAVTGA